MINNYLNEPMLKNINMRELENNVYYFFFKKGMVVS